MNDLEHYLMDTLAAVRDYRAQGLDPYEAWHRVRTEQALDRVMREQMATRVRTEQALDRVMREQMATQPEEGVMIMSSEQSHEDWITALFDEQGDLYSPALVSKLATEVTSRLAEAYEQGRQAERRAIRDDLMGRTNGEDKILRTVYKDHPPVDLEDK